MTYKEFEKFMIDQYNAYWVSFWTREGKDALLIRLNDTELAEQIYQIDSIGLSRGNESLMIDLTVWHESAKWPIEITCKMLGSNLKRCFEIMPEILDKIPVSL